MKLTEYQLHSQIVEYLKLKRALFTSTLGGVYLNSWKQKKLVKKHYAKGVPDILIFEPQTCAKPSQRPANYYSGLAIEVKIKPNKPTKNQLNWLTALNDRNFLGVVVYDFEQAKDIIDNYLYNEQLDFNWV
jgi:hypothetical protein